MRSCWNGCASWCRAGRRGETVEAFQAAIGLPEAMIAGMRESPFRAVLEGMAPTLAYDTAVANDTAVASNTAVANGGDPARYAGVTAPVLVLDSEASPGLLRTACRDMAEAVPGAIRRSLSGGFHDVEAGVMGPALIEFFGKAG